MDVKRKGAIVKLGQGTNARNISDEQKRGKSSGKPKTFIGVSVMLGGTPSKRGIVRMSRKKEFRKIGRTRAGETAGTANPPNASKNISTLRGRRHR